MILLRLSACRVARSRAAWLVAGVVGLAGLTLQLGGCSDAARVDKVEQANRVQDERLRNLEEGLAEAVRKQNQPVLDQMKALDARNDSRMAALGERIEQLLQEQMRISGALEVDQSDIKRFARRLEEAFKAQAQVRLEQENDFDKLRLRMKDVEALLKSPIAGLPATTEPDKAYREAMFLMISGQLDVAADKFQAFVQTYPNDRRRPEAQYRQGQAFFLMRKYDFALVPLYELLDKQAGSKLAPEARWMLARSLEETGDLKLAREFYAQLINAKTVYSADASRRVVLINRLYPATETPGRGPRLPADKPAPATRDSSATDNAEKPRAESKGPDTSKTGATDTSKADPGKADSVKADPLKDGGDGAAAVQATK